MWQIWYPSWFYNFISTNVTLVICNMIWHNLSVEEDGQRVRFSLDVDTQFSTLFLHKFSKWGDCHSTRSSNARTISHLFGDWCHSKSCQIRHSSSIRLHGISPHNSLYHYIRGSGGLPRSCGLINSIYDCLEVLQKLFKPISIISRVYF